ncbi:carboxypeptidase-like regulatory domain-containing protein, partial [Deltaproteobacteria bacterium]|nr:carboxypeptidase-like regulatory domain-containing protein [Deltaproteobacteria bacterium]
MSYAQSGTTIVDTATDSSGDFSKTLALGTYTLTYSKSGYLDEIQSATLSADNQTLVVSTLMMLPDSCTSGTISGTIKNASNRSVIEGVSLIARRGLNLTTGTIAKTETTSNTGTYSFSGMSPGWYTVETSKSGYIASTFHVYACGNQSGWNSFKQGTYISTTLDPGAMRIVLSWKTTDDLDSHLTGPDNLSGQGHSNASHEQFHLYYPPASNKFYYATNDFSCSGCSANQMSDNVTLDLDSFKGIGSCNTCGPETTTISAVRGGTYSYYVHNYREAGQNNLKLAASAASVKVYYNDNVTTFNVPNSAADLWYVFDFDNSSGFTAINTMGSDSSFTADIFAPKLSEVTAVTTPDNDTTPNYTFSSNEAGTIAYGGSCSSSDTSANVDNNTITFNTLAEGTYDNCTIRVTDSASNTSDNLSVSTFTIDTTAPSLTQVTAVPSPTRDNTSSYTFTTNEVGTISYSGGCSSSDNNTAAADDNITITFNELADNTYNCSVIVTDNAGNPGTLSVQFIIDTTAPTLSEVTPVSTPTLDPTPRYRFGSNEAGVITYGGSCSSSTAAASANNSNYIDFNTLPDGTYSDCTVRVTDSAGNVSNALPVTQFTVSVPPYLTQVTTVPTPTSDNTPDFTFSSNEAGTITYGGACGSLTSSAATSGNNTVTLTQTDNSTPLSDGTYDNCTIAVTDNTSKTSDNLSVSSFTIGAIQPALVQITPVPSLTNDNTSNYTFYSTLPGEINYSGDCDSDNTTAVGEDNNTITFKPLGEGAHSNCKVSVTTSGGVTSDNLSVNSFVIDTIAPSLSQVTAIPHPTNDNSPDYTFYSNEAGDITYGGTCGSNSYKPTTSSAADDNNTVTFRNLVHNTTYSDCTITVTDNATNASSALAVNIFAVDTVSPTLNWVIPGGLVPTPDNDSTPDFTFSSNEAGDISYTGSCGSSSPSAATSGDNTVTLTQPDNSTVLSDGTYSNCYIYVTDNATNQSNIRVRGWTQAGSYANYYFTVGATKPALLEITPVPTSSNDNTSTYTFYSTLPGTINYSGGCNSDNDSTALADNNTVTFNALADNTYSNCKISVTTSSGVVSDNLSVNSFTIDTTAPELDTVNIRSNNDNTTIARVGNIIYLDLIFSENVNTPTVLIAGQSASRNSGSGRTWVYRYTMQSSDSEGSVSLSVAFTDINTNAGTTVTNTTNGSTVLFDQTAPTLSEVTAVSTPTGDNSTNYTFYSNEAGTIGYAGDCSSSSTSATADNNTITFNELADGTHNNCIITVTDSTGNTSNNLQVSSFRIDTTAPTLSQVTAVSTPTGDNSPDYTFNSNEAGTISYGGACGSSTSSSASSGHNTVTLTRPDNSTALSDGTYDNCTIAVTDNLNNTSDNLSVSSFTIAAVKPILLQVTAVPNPTNDNTPNYTFYSTLQGTINYSGGCDSDNNTSAVGDDNNTVTFNALAENTYNDCKISVTHNTVPSDNLSVNSFTIDTTPPSLNQVTPVPTRDNDSTPNYTFYSNEVGDITYGGGCNSSDTSADADNNTITLNALADATYSNCTITVRDNASNTSDNLTVNQFTIDTTGPVLDNVTNVPTPSSDNTSSYSFNSSEAGAITYGGSCESTTSAAVAGTNNIIFNALPDGTYNNCTITVTDNLSNASSLSVNTFEIDTTDPIVTEVTAVTTPGNDTTPSYTF